MLVLFTDFGAHGPYVGQMIGALRGAAPEQPVVELFSDVPPFDVMAGAYLLPAYAAPFGPGTVFVCVVDPGVGGSRAPLVLEADGRTYVGPDNGLLMLAARRAAAPRWWTIAWRPPALSASFHGRDLFAPVAARLARGAAPCGPARAAAELVGHDWPDDLARIVYVDRYGNAVTGLRTAGLPAAAVLRAGATRLSRARTFSDVPAGTAFWYDNANGLAEIAVNRGSAAAQLGLAPGAAVEIEG